LIVDGKPFLALAGELYNNSATSLEHMNAVWPRLTSMHLNTVLAAISWAMLEPSEGKFDYALVDGLIREARVHNLRLVLLWFGSWKNTWSSYAPDWVKRDFTRFPRAGTVPERRG
jgi:beta-galactosidase GanA